MNPATVPNRHRRRKFLASLAVLALGGGAYARWMEPGWLAVSRAEVKLGRGLPRTPLKLLHLSDLHASSTVSLAFIEKAIRAGVALAPDLICLTGDFVTGEYEPLDRYAEVLSLLPKRAPTFACLGNHDGGRWAESRGGYPTLHEITNLLNRSRIELLDGTTRSVRVGDWPIQLTGTSDLWAGGFAPEQAFARAEAAPVAVKVLLAHNPDTKDQVKACAWDLMLSGHTHGGQCCLPLIGAPFVPVKDKRYVMGLHRWEGRWLHITKGIGNLYGVRFDYRPEISLLTFT